MSTETEVPPAAPPPAAAPANGSEPAAEPRGAPGVRKEWLWSVRPLTPRDSGDAIVSSFLLHWFPAKSFARSLDWSYSLWLGTITSALFLLLILSGLPLVFLHVPSVERAYGSVKDIEYVVTFGSWIRSVHRVSAHLMVATAFLHMVRVFVTGAYKNGSTPNQHRPWNWAIGVGMLVVTLLLSFTGYLLPWDQLAFWAITVGTNIVSAVPVIGESIRSVLLGGREIDQPTLMRFYALHVVALPLGLGVLFMYHIWRIRKDGGLASADRPVLPAERREVAPGKTKTYTLLGIARGTGATIRATAIEARAATVSSVPDLLRRIGVVVLGTMVLVSIASAFIPSPLEEPANPLVTPNPAKAPWYFLWLQEIVTDTTLKLGSFTINGALIGGVLLPGALVTLALVWPWLDKSPAEATGVWFARSRRTQNIVFLLIVAAILALTIVGTFCRGPYWGLYWPWESWPELPTRI